jgi:hypothetical protein
MDDRAGAQQPVLLLPEPRLDLLAVQDGRVPLPARETTLVWSLATAAARAPAPTRKRSSAVGDEGLGCQHRGRPPGSRPTSAHAPSSAVSRSAWLADEGEAGEGQVVLMATRGARVTTLTFR